MKISVAMTTYNGSKYIIEQLDSLRKQTKPINEVIIFDDCSSDETINLINNYIGFWKLNDWSLYVNEENLGWVKNFHRCIEKTSGDVVFFCDQDDVWYEDKIEKIMEIFEKYKDAFVVVHKTRLINSKGQRISDNQESFPYASNDSEIIRKNVLDMKFTYTNSPGCTMAVNRKLIELVEKLPKEEIPHDALYWKIATVMRTAYSIDEALINYRIHASNASKPENNHKYVAKNNHVRIKEALKLKNQVEKVQSMCSILAPEYVKLRDLQIVCDNLKFNQVRIEYLQRHNIALLFRLMHEINYYRNYKMFLGDILSVLKG